MGINVYLNKFFEFFLLEHLKPVSIWTLKLEENLFVLICWSSAPRRLCFTQNSQQRTVKKFSKLKLVLHVPAKKFKEIVKINIDPHKILDNFCLMKNYLEECLSHHSAKAYWKIMFNLTFNPFLQLFSGLYLNIRFTNPSLIMF